MGKLSDKYVQFNNSMEYGFRNLNTPLRFASLGTTGAMALKIFGVKSGKSILISLIAIVLMLIYSWLISKTKLQNKQLEYDTYKNKAWLKLEDQVDRIEKLLLKKEINA